MSNIGICEYVIGIIHDSDIWYSVGKKGDSNRYSSALPDAKRYDDLEVLRDELEALPKTACYKVLEIQQCPKCKKEFTEHPALSRIDNETEICPECGVREAVEAYMDAVKD